MEKKPKDNEMKLKIANLLKFENNRSIIERISSILKESEIEDCLSDFFDNSSIRYNWKLWGRPAQKLPENFDWKIWAIVGMRGSGKTRAASEGIRSWAETHRKSKIALIGATYADSDIMLNGISGLRNISELNDRPVFVKSKRQLNWKNGCVADLYSAEALDNFRFSSHRYDAIWAEEITYWRNEKAWEILNSSLSRENAQIICTIDDRKLENSSLAKSITSDSSTVTSILNTLDNASNLPTAFIERLLEKYPLLNIPEKIDSVEEQAA